MCCIEKFANHVQQNFTVLPLEVMSLTKGLFAFRAEAIFVNRCLHLMREVERRSRDGGREKAYYNLYENNFL